MKIKDAFLPQPLTQKARREWIGRDGVCRTEEEGILREHTVCISISNGRKARLTCLPQYLTELALGHLLTEGWIASADEVEEIAVSEDGKESAVLLAETWMDSARPLPVVPSAKWRAEWVFELADRFAEGMPLHTQTYGTHSCLLARKGELLFACEDLGRHNALDKAVGYALRNGVNLGECFLYSSGRIPADMVRKALLAGVPLLAGKGSPTAEAVELARCCGLTLICAARRDRMKQFSGSFPQT